MLSHLTRQAPLISHSAIRRHPHFLYVGFPRLDEHGGDTGPSLRLHDLRRGLSGLHRMERHYLHPLAHAQRLSEARNPSFRVSVQGLWIDMDLPIQSVPQHLSAADSRLHVLREAVQLEQLHRIIYHDSDRGHFVCGV